MMAQYGCRLMRKSVRNITGSLGLWLICLWSTAFIQQNLSAQPVVLHVAAAADLQYALPLIAKAFEQVNPSVRVQCTFASSGMLATQILAGAPFHVFLAGDTAYPQRLVRAGKSERMHMYAQGKLVLWHSGSIVQTSNLVDVLQPNDKIAIANPRHAPFGQRAMEAILYHFSEYQWKSRIQPHIVYTDNVMQAAHYALSGNVRFAWLPLSVVLAPALRNHGSYTIVPEHSHQPIIQGACAVYTKDQRMYSTAKDFVKFLSGEDAHNVFRQFGYVMVDGR